MKNFSDLLAIDHWLDVLVTSHQGTVRLRWPLLVNLDLACQDPTSVMIDGMDITNFGYHHDGMWRISLHEPFYRWRHRVTGQGWLLEPVQHL